MKNLLYLTIVWLGLTGGSVLAKDPVVWNRGQLLLNNGTVLEGELNYNWKAEVVQFRQDNAIKAFSVFQVQRFKYYDKLHNVLRTFTTVDFPIKKALLRPLFLEEIVAGPLMVYRRLRHVREPIRIMSVTDFSTDEELVKDFDNFDYYVFEEGTITELESFLRDSWPQMQNQFKHELNQYIERLHVDPSATTAKLMLINQYNYLRTEANQPILTGSARNTVGL